jgi:hypothetical protein
VRFNLKHELLFQLLQNDKSFANNFVSEIIYLTTVNDCHKTDRGIARRSVKCVFQQDINDNISIMVSAHFNLQGCCA